MADTIAVMNARPDRAARRPGRALREPATRRSSPTSSASPTCSRHGRPARDGDDLVLDVHGERAARCPAARCAGHDGRSGSASGRRSCASRRADRPVTGNRLTGTVTDASFIGVSTQYLVQLRWGQELDGRPAERRHAAAACPASQVTVHWAPEHGFALDARQDAHAGEDRRTRRRCLWSRARERVATPPVPAPPPPGARRRSVRRAPVATPYLLLLPGMRSGWSSSSPSRWSSWPRRRCRPAPWSRATCVTWHFADLRRTRSRQYYPQFLRSLVLRRRRPRCSRCCIGYPLAYAIAFKAGRWRNLLLVLVIAPFFTSFLIRTLAWQTILAEQRPGRRTSSRQPGCIDVCSCLGSTDNDQLMATPFAVICGLTYNFLPFMIAAALRQSGADRPARCTRQPATCTRTRSPRSARSPCRCPCRASWPARC